jgi:hypothetical protein
VTTETNDRAMLDLLAAKPDYPTLSNLAELAVDRGVCPNVDEACRQLTRLYKSGEVESFDVDGIGPFLAVKGRLPNASDLPKAGDEIELISGTEVGP